MSEKLTTVWDRFLLWERPHRVGGGVQRLYRLPNGRGLSVVNSVYLHAYSFAWEIAVLREVSEDGHDFRLDYSTELTDDVVVTFSQEETEDWLQRAFAVLESLPESKAPNPSGVEDAEVISIEDVNREPKRLDA